MKKHELDQLVLIEHILEGKLTQKEAAQLMGLSVRQVRRKVKRYLHEGPTRLAHGNRGKQSNRSTDPTLVKKILDKLTTVYHGFGPTLVAEKLKEFDGIEVSHDTVNRVMRKNGLIVPRKMKKVDHVWRERKHHFGELVQVDGSLHLWFNNEYSTLIAFIDDATSTVELMFADHETTKSLSEAMQRYLGKHGRPRALYADRGKVYSVNHAKDDGPRRTQFVRMLNELDICMINAYSPQAKGRVERLFRTLQDRLVKELKLRGITTIAEANKFLQDSFIVTINEKLRVPAKSTVDLHRPMKDIDTSSIFCIKEYRKLNDDRTIRYKNRWFLLSRKQPVKLHRSRKITVCVSFDGTISLVAANKKLNYAEINKPKKQKPKEVDKIVKEMYRKPKKNHPWREPGLDWENRTFLKR